MAVGFEPGMEKTGVEFNFGYNEKGAKETKQATDNMIGLLADLSIIGKVASDAINGLWSNIQKPIRAGLESFDDINVGLKFDVDPNELNALKYALGKIGADEKDATKMLGQLDKVARSFQDPATGPDAIAKFYKDSAVYGVGKEQQDIIIKALKEDDLVEALKLLVNTRDDLGDKFSNYMTELNLDSLGFGEIDFQMEDWVKAWENASSVLTKVDAEDMDDLSDAMANWTATLNNLANTFSMAFGDDLLQLSETILRTSKKLGDWVDAFTDGSTFFDAYSKYQREKGEKRGQALMDKVPLLGKAMGYTKNKNGEWVRSDSDSNAGRGDFDLNEYGLNEDGKKFLNTLKENVKSNFELETYAKPYVNLWDRLMGIGKGKPENGDFNLQEHINKMENNTTNINNENNTDGSKVYNITINGVELSTENFDEFVEQIMELSEKDAELSGVY